MGTSSTVVVETGLAVDVRVLLQQPHRVHHRPVGGVVALEAQRVQQRRQHLPVVRAVRRPQGGADPGLEDLLLDHSIGPTAVPRRGKRGRPATRDLLCGWCLGQDSGAISRDLSPAVRPASRCFTSTVQAITARSLRPTAVRPPRTARLFREFSEWGLACLYSEARPHDRRRRVGRYRSRRPSSCPRRRAGHAMREGSRSPPARWRDLSFRGVKATFISPRNESMPPNRQPRPRAPWTAHGQGDYRRFT